MFFEITGEERWRLLPQRVFVETDVIIYTWNNWYGFYKPIHETSLRMSFMKVNAPVKNMRSRGNVETYTLQMLK